MTSDETIPEADRAEGAPHPRETARLIGQEQAEATFLQSYATGRLHHAWMLTGPKGVGKATLAWHIVRFLLSQDTQESGSGLFGDPAPAPQSLHIAPDTPVFRRVAALGEPGVFLCRRAWDEKAGRLKTAISVDDVRKLKSFFALSAAEGGWRIAIVDSADEMTVAAENALLKILEEPPEKALILLVCHQPSKLLPTIRSRCRELRCEPLVPMQLVEALTEAGLGTPEGSDALTELAGGSVGEAVSLLHNDGVALYSEILQLLATAPRMNRQGMLSLSDRCAGRTAAGFYDLTIRLLMLALSRLALAGARGSDSGIDAERHLAQRFSHSPRQAQEWAALVQTLNDRISHARAVNLDPAQVIFDTLAAIESTAARTFAPAA